jgi:predicted transcriptional regulator
VDSESDEYTAFFQRQYPRVVSMLIAYRGFTPEIAEDAAAEAMTLTLVDMTPSEIAEVLGCTPEQARGNLAHARRAVSSAIQKEAGGGTDTQRPR